MKLLPAQKTEIADIYAQMQENFIEDEIREFCDAVKVFDKDNYKIYHLRKDDDNLGFMCVWELSGFAFLEHFVIYSQYRGRGYGGEALTALKNKYGKVILECEPPISEDQKRRLNFYLRNEMVFNDEEYWQPAYRKNGNKCFLKLLSYPKAIEDFSFTVEEIYREVYNCAKK